MGQIDETTGRLRALLGAEHPCPRGCGKVAHGRPDQVCRACWEADARDRWRREVGRVIADVRRGMPARMRDLGDANGITLLRARMRSADRDAAIDLALEAVSTRRNLVLRGPSTAGKTSLGCATLVWHVRKLIGPVDFDDPNPGSGWRWEFARTCLFARAADLVHADEIHPRGQGEAPLVRDAMTAAVLLIDDLGAEGGREIDRTITRVVTVRGDDDLPMVVTTSQPDEKLVHRYGEGAARRILSGLVAEVR